MLNQIDEGLNLLAEIDFIYRKIVSSNTSRLEAHVGFFRLLREHPCIT